MRDTQRECYYVLSYVEYAHPICTTRSIHFVSPIIYRKY